jgi:hypothetical protein
MFDQTRVIFFRIAISLALCCCLFACATVPAVGEAPRADVLGTWSWFNGKTVTISPDHTLKADGDSGTWKAVSADGRTVQLSWASSWVDTLTLSADGKRLEGHNNEGNEVSGTRP